MSKAVVSKTPRAETTPYDVAEHLRTPEEMAAYLDAWFAADLLATALLMPRYS